MQNFMELHTKKFSAPKALWHLGLGLGPKTNLGQFGSKAFGKGLIKP